MMNVIKKLENLEKFLNKQNANYFKRINNDYKNYINKEDIKNDKQFKKSK